MNWNYLVLIICLAVALFTVVKEYRPSNKQRLTLRIAASLIGIAALAAIALPLTYNSEITKPFNEAVLLTTGFNKDSLSNYKTDTLYTIDSAIKNQYPKTKLITAGQLEQIAPAITHLHVLGYGLPGYELKQLDGIPVIFYPERNPGGIIAASWPLKLKQGEPLIVQGKYSHIDEGQVRLILKELNTTVDSATIEQQGNSDFQLTGVPKSTGRIVDRLIVLHGKDTLENENLPLIIEPVQPLKVLMLAASPEFENKFLKNWLIEKGFAVAMRSAISKDKFSTEFISLPQIPLSQLSTGVLGKFDILIADLSALQTLSAVEQASLKKEISQNALGLLIRADTVFKTGALFQAEFQVYKAILNDQKPSLLRLQGKKTVSKILNPSQLFIKSNDGMQILVNDSQNRSLASTSLVGLGKVACTTLDNTYTWRLGGNKDDYAAFWSLLIGKVAKIIPQTENWSIVNPNPAINIPLTVQLETGQQPGQIIMDSKNASPMQSETLPFQWQSTIWTAKAGWQTINHTGGIAQWLYVYNPTDWASIKTVNSITATKKYNLKAKASDLTKRIPQKVKVLVPKGYFYMLLLLCCTFLWIVDKLSASATG